MTVMEAAEHVWLQVNDRRWCLGCRAFQGRRDQWHDWRPSLPAVCAADTPWAEDQRKVVPLPRRGSRAA